MHKVDCDCMPCRMGSAQTRFNAPRVRTNAPRGTTNAPRVRTNAPRGTTNAPRGTTNGDAGTGETRVNLGLECQVCGQRRERNAERMRCKRASNPSSKHTPNTSESPKPSSSLGDTINKDA